MNLSTLTERLKKRKSKTKTDDFPLPDILLNYQSDESKLERNYYRLECRLTELKKTEFERQSLKIKLDQMNEKIIKTQKEMGTISENLHLIQNKKVTALNQLVVLKEQNKLQKQKKIHKIRELEGTIKTLKNSPTTKLIKEKIEKKREKLRNYTAKTNSLKSYHKKLLLAKEKSNKTEKKKIFSLRVGKEVFLLKRNLTLLLKKENKIIWKLNNKKTKSGGGLIYLEEINKITGKKIRDQETIRRNLVSQIKEYRELLNQESTRNYTDITEISETTDFSEIDSEESSLFSESSKIAYLKNLTKYQKRSKSLGNFVRKMKKLRSKSDLNIYKSQTLESKIGTTNEVTIEKEEQEQEKDKGKEKENKSDQKQEQKQKQKQEQEQEQEQEQIQEEIENIKKQETKTKPKKLNHFEELISFLNTPKGIELFKDFLRKQLCQENLLFWQDVKNMKQNCTTKKEIQTKAKKIFKLYILTGSIFEINIISSLRNKLIKLKKQNHYFLTMFDEASSDVMDHMAFNSWGEFKRTKQYLAMKREIKKHNINSPSLKYKKVKFRYKLDQNEVLNEQYFYHGKVKSPISLITNLLFELYQLLYAHYSVSRNKIHIDKVTQSVSFKRWEKQTSKFKGVVLDTLDENERKIFFLNLYNCLTLHSTITSGLPNKLSQWNTQKKQSYLIGKTYFNIDDILNGILRCNTKRKIPEKILKKVNERLKKIPYKKLLKNDKMYQQFLKLKEKFNYFPKDDERTKYRLVERDPRLLLAILFPDDLLFLDIFREKNFDEQLKKVSLKVLKNCINNNSNGKIVLPYVFHELENDFDQGKGALNWILDFFSVNVISELLVNQKIKYKTKIHSHICLILNFEKYSLKNWLRK
ncbi:electron carrier/ protein disulfide oxidoreductase [Anaeramoeba flamelloides]|uniref:Electron carrier/ protein disulfide oxidoreductase n=1 Tax=Anaeramoeba flamelloides TaxID=1746091 RepID=A0ABQ8XZU9_9EUKA|nr:electron carrier/ protein disulfide oxidoreductase [Anaeramoeba flamelloides]